MRELPTLSKLGQALVHVLQSEKIKFGFRTRNQTLLSKPKAIYTSSDLFSIMPVLRSVKFPTQVSTPVTVGSLQLCPGKKSEDQEMEQRRRTSHKIDGHT